MKKNEITTVDKLQIGDRFYFLNDANKVVWEMVDHESKSTFYRTYTHFCLLGSYADRISDRATRDRQAKGIQGNTKVVYLRSTASALIKFRVDYQIGMDKNAMRNHVNMYGTSPFDVRSSFERDYQGLILNISKVTE